jgi:hypothetical protein
VQRGQISIADKAGRESFGPMATTPILGDVTPQENAEALFANLMQQANSARPSATPRARR